MLDRERILSRPALEVPFRYTARDTMLHGLAIGIGMDPGDAMQVGFVYDKGLRAFPALANVLGWIDMVRDPRTRDDALGIDPHRMVVCGVSLRLERPLPVAGEGTARTFFAEVLDRGPGKAGLVCVRRELRSAALEPLATIDTWLHVAGAGGFGGPGEGGPEKSTIPQREPDALVTLPTPPNLALLYRLSLNDQNALHAEPDYARRAGFERPILHGLASFSIAVHAVLRGLARYDVERFRAGHARMVAPVLPGDSLRTAMWQGEGGICFRTEALERKVIVMDGGGMTLRPA